MLSSPEAPSKAQLTSWTFSRASGKEDLLVKSLWAFPLISERAIPLQTLIGVRWHGQNNGLKNLQQILEWGKPKEFCISRILRHSVDEETTIEVTPNSYLTDEHIGPSPSTFCSALPLSQWCALIISLLGKLSTVLLIYTHQHECKRVLDLKWDKVTSEMDGKIKLKIKIRFRGCWVVFCCCCCFAFVCFFSNVLILPS